jgi:hypothetical protein
MSKEVKRWLLGLVGLAVLFGSSALFGKETTHGLLLIWTGAIILAVGTGFALQTRGRSFWNGVFILIPGLGILIVLSLYYKDKTYRTKYDTIITIIVALLMILVILAFIFIPSLKI